ncbi:MAG: hypothetical protein HKP61_08655 [Dactylosporangium sp.]|nr:hypothetical protein [Dactylosporangium sp.]NNJ61005.1 hypothetical protein [Dactylosporangium sp.]
MRNWTSRIAVPGGRRVIAGLTDQVLVAVTSASLLLVAATVLSRPEAGRMLYAAQIMVFLQGASRAVIGDVLLTHAARFDDGPARRRQFENAHATALLLAAAGVLAVGATLLLAPGWCPSDLLWGLPFIPAILAQDLARYTYQSLLQQSRALAVDVVWVGVQVTGIVVVIAAGRAGGGPLLACWGSGAAVAAAVFYRRTKINPLRGRPVAWLRDTRHLLGWYTATGLLAQTTTLLIGTLVQGLLSKSAYAGFRLVQMLVLQPAQSLAMALNGLLVPRASRLAGAGDVPGLHRQTRAVLAVTAAVGCAILLAAAGGAGPALAVYKGGGYANVAVIAIPIGLQTLGYLMQVPFTVAIRGMQRGRPVFTQYVVHAGTSLGGLVVGAWLWQLPGAAWGLVTGATVGLLFQGWQYRAITRRLAPARVTRDAGPGHPAGAA